MRWFEAGIVALPVALAVVLTFRQLDRNNRSLEKVKRYGDRVMNTLSTFVDTKSSEIRDLAIEVQVSVKQGKELLRSVREVRDDLAGRSRDLEERSAEIEAIRSRIDGYDTALSELVNMSERVDDNLRRLRGEDERLRRIDEHRTALQERLAALDVTATSVEGRLRRVEHTAEQALSDNLTDFQQRFADDLASRADELKTRQEGWHAQMESGIAKRFAALDAELTELVARLAVFTDQTPLLERAERMHEEISHLDTKLADLQRQRHEVAALEQELERARKIGAEVTGALARVSADRHRVEAMERDFRRLLAIAEDVEGRLDTMATGRQAVEEVQAKLQRLDELAASVDARYEQLSHRHEKAEATSSGVDRNFELLGQLDEQVIGLRPDVLKLAAGLAELQGRLDALAAEARIERQPHRSPARP